MKSGKWVKNEQKKGKKLSALGSIFSDGMCQRYVKWMCIFSWPIIRVTFVNEYLWKGS